jgi:hypothetical protein
VRYAGQGATLLDGDPQIGWYSLKVPAIFQLFAADHGGVLCGGAAYALARLYEAFGYRAWLLNSGIQQRNTTHVATLVEIAENGGPLLCLQDAYFNYGIVDSGSGRPVDYFSLLKRLRGGNHQSLRLQEPDVREVKPWPAMLVGAGAKVRTPEKIAASAWPIQEQQYTVTQLADGSLKFVSPRILERFLARCCRTREGEPAWYLEWLAAQGHPLELVYLYLYPFEIHGPGGDDLLQKAHQITNAPA